MTQVVRQNRRVLLTVGLGVLAIGLARSSRVVVVPLWAEHVGLDAAQTSLVFAAAALVEVVLFYPAGTVMDRHGRVWVAVPVTLLLGLGLLALPLTTTLAGVGALALLMGVGNGLGSGIVMTLGADAAPTAGRAPFLGVWRLLSLVGHNGAALVVGRRRRGRDHRCRERGGRPADPRRRRLAGPLGARVRPPPARRGGPRRGATRCAVSGTALRVSPVNVGLPT